MQPRPYEHPVVIDYGSLTDLTNASAIGGLEDGASKNDQPNHHSIPSLPGVN